MALRGAFPRLTNRGYIEAWFLKLFGYSEPTFPRITNRGYIEVAFCPRVTENEGMVILGHIQNGVVILENAPVLPDGTPVEVVVRAVPGDEKSPASRPAQVLGQIASLPTEGAAGPFSGADHDRLLYGES